MAAPRHSSWDHRNGSVPGGATGLLRAEARGRGWRDHAAVVCTCATLALALCATAAGTEVPRGGLLTCSLRLRGGSQRGGEDATPKTPLTPGRASRRLMNVSPELKDASPSMLSGRRKKTKARVAGTADARGDSPVAGANSPRTDSGGGGAASASASPPRPAPAGRSIEIRRSTFDKIMESLEKGKRASIKSGHGRRIGVVLNKRGEPVTMDGRTLVKGDDIRDMSSLSEEPEPEPAAKPAANPKRPLKFEPRPRAPGPVAGPERPAPEAGSRENSETPQPAPSAAPCAAQHPQKHTDVPVAFGVEGPARKKKRGSAMPLPLQAGALSGAEFDLGVLRDNLTALRRSLAERLEKGIVSQENADKILQHEEKLIETLAQKVGKGSQNPQGSISAIDYLADEEDAVVTAAEEEAEKEEEEGEVDEEAMAAAEEEEDELLGSAVSGEQESEERAEGEREGGRDGEKGGGMAGPWLVRYL